MSLTRDPIAVRRMVALIALSIASALVFVSAASCKKVDDDGSPPLVAGDANQPRVVRSQADDGGITGDPQVLGFLLAADDKAVQRATIAESKATDGTVRDFAAQMVKDHGADAEKLRTIAKQKNMSPASSGPTQDIESDSDDTVDKLDRLKAGASFDRNYLEEEIILQLKEMAAIDQDVAPITSDMLVGGAVSDARAASVAQREKAEELLKIVRSDAGAPVPTSTSTSWIDSSAPDARALLGDSGVEIE